MTTWKHDVYARSGARLGVLCLALVGCNSLLGNEPVRERMQPDAALSQIQPGEGGEGGSDSGGVGGERSPSAGGEGGRAGRGGRAGGSGASGRSAEGGSGARAGEGGKAEGGAGAAAGSGGTSGGGTVAGGGAGGAGAPSCDSLHCPEHSTCDPNQPECRCDGGYELLVGVCVNRNECLTNNGGCDAHAACEDTPGGYNCSCVAPYVGDGKTCKLDDSCQMRKCDVHASCTADGCKCLSGYEGDGVTCTRIDPCKSTPCKNGGACTSNASGFDCNCNSTGFTGQTCEEPIDDCAVKPCKNGATCTDLVKDYKCSCKAGWSGKQCDVSTGCDYKGMHYDNGAKFEAGDGCNTCTCDGNGQVTCTTNSCTVTCGGLIGKLCPTGQFCNFPIGSNCGIADQQGTCAAMGGKICPAIVQQVCGCDGKTYNNSCLASSAGVSVRAEGACVTGCDYNGVHHEPGSSFPASDGCNTCSCGTNGTVVCTKIACTAGCGSTKCPATQYCSWPLEAQCGQGNVAGICKAKPDACLDVFQPVCGCDNKTYSNSCYAAVAGMSIKSQEACTQ